MSSHDSWIASALFAASFAAVALTQALNKNRRSTVVISDLYIYPIKSCGGIKVNSARVTKRGFEYDRHFMVVDAEGGFVTQRKKPKMALIATAIDYSRKILTVSAPGMPDLVVSLAPSKEEQAVSVRVWKDKCTATVVNTQNWFATFLELPGLELVRFDESFVRGTELEFAPLGQVAFADGFPFLIASQASIDEVTQRFNANNKANTSSTVDSVSMLRFRPNIVVRNCTAFAEDSWKDVVIQCQSGSAPLRAKIVKPCARCSMPDVDPVTAVYDKEMKIGRLLQSFRTGAHMKLDKWKKEVPI